MSTPTPPEPPVVDGRLLRLLKALGQAGAAQSSRPTQLDLFGPLGEAQKKVKEAWPQATPPGDGGDYLEQYLKMMTRRLRWRFRIETGRELVVLLGQFAGIVLSFGVAWQLFVV